MLGQPEASTTIGTRETLDDIARHWHPAHSAARGIALHPNPGFESFRRERDVLRKAVMHIEARPAELRDRALDDDVVAETGRQEKARMCIDQGMAGATVGPEIFGLSHSDRLLDESRGAGVKKRKV